jgi:TatD DNase family protein
VTTPPTPSLPAFTPVEEPGGFSNQRETGGGWTDSHCHLDDAGIPGGADVALDAARLAGVTRFVTVGTDAVTSAAAVALAAAHPDVWATVGLHPHDASQGVDTVVPLLDRPRIVAVGECGLDYHYNHSPRDIQRAAFAAQVALARARHLTLVIHTREAWADTFAILGAEALPERIVFHCFTGGPDEARLGLDLGAYLSFSGIVSFKGADDVRAAAALCPPDHLLVETDAPYLAPMPHRGRPNEPAYLPAVGAALAAATKRDIQTVAEQTNENAGVAFCLPAT